MDVWSTGEWKPDDNIRMWVDLPTVDHLEMARHDMLALAMEPITAFLAGHGGTGPVSPGLPPPDSLGVRVYNAVKGVPGSMRSLMEGLTQESPSRIRIDQLLPILHAIYATGTDAPLPAPIQNAWKKNPTSAWLQYTRLRMRRGAVMLCPEDVPCFFPQTVRIVERTLSKRQGVVGHTPARPLRLLGLAVDLGHALVRTAWARGRRRLSYPGWWSWLR